MRAGGIRLVTAVMALVLVGAAGCSDPAGAQRKLEAEARSKSPSPTVSTKFAKVRPKTPIWRQSPGVTKSSAKAGLRVKTGHLFGGRVTVVVTDTKTDVHRTIIASAKPRREDVGRYVLTAIKVTGSSAQDAAPASEDDSALATGKSTGVISAPHRLHVHIWSYSRKTFYMI